MCLQTETVNWKYTFIWGSYKRKFVWYYVFFFIFSASCRRERWLFFSESWSARATDRIGHLTFLTRNNEILATTICLPAMTSSAHIAKSVAPMARFAAGLRVFWCRSLDFHQKLNLWCRSSSLSTCPLCKNSGCWWITLECAIIKQAPRQTQQRTN